MFCKLESVTQFVPFRCISVHSGSFFFTGSRVPEYKFSLTYLQQHVAENRAEPVKTMAASFARKPFLFSEVLSTVLGRFISEIERQYAENMRYSHPRWARPNWFSGKHFSVENGVLTIDSERFQSTVADFRLRWQVFDSWRQSAQHYVSPRCGTPSYKYYLVMI